MDRQPQLSRFQRAVENGTLLTTLGMKLVGLASGFNQLLLQDHHDALKVLLSGLLIAGGNGLEVLALTLLDWLARESHAAAHPPANPPA